VVIAAADAAVAVTLHFASFTTFCVAATVVKQHEPLLVDGVGGVGGEIMTAIVAQGVAPLAKKTSMTMMMTGAVTGKNGKKMSPRKQIQLTNYLLMKKLKHQRIKISKML
jgi:hypothetical protein